MAEFEDAFRTAFGLENADDDEHEKITDDDQEEIVEDVDKKEDGENVKDNKNQDNSSDKSQDTERPDNIKVLPSNDNNDTTKGIDFDKLLLEKSGGKFKSYTDIERALEEIPQDAFANETVAKLNDYVKNGGSPMDFLKTQTTDYSQMDDVQAIKEHMALTKKGLSSEDIDFLVQNKYGVSKDATESEKRLAKIEMKAAANDAKQALLENQQKWSVPQVQGRPTQEDVLREKQRWENTLKETTKVFNKFEVEIGDGNFEYAIQDQDRNSLVEKNKDLTKFFNRYQNEDGSENTAKFIKDMFILDNFDKIAKALAVHAKGKGTEDVIDTIKNPDFKGTDDKGANGKKSLLAQVGENIFG